MRWLCASSNASSPLHLHVRTHGKQTRPSSSSFECKRKPHRRRTLQERPRAVRLPLLNDVTDEIHQRGVVDLIFVHDR